jgi:hypothetical protein
MAGLVPAIHVFVCCDINETWLPGHDKLTKLDEK